MCKLVGVLALVHELIHTLDDGATTGPNKCPESGRHYCDDPSDILAPAATVAKGLATSTLDVARDDYCGGGHRRVRDLRIVKVAGAFLRVGTLGSIAECACGSAPRWSSVSS